MARPVSIGVQAATMIDCPARVPLIIFAKRCKINVKDPVDLDAVRLGRLIHAAFERAMTAVDEAGKLGDGAAATGALERAITTVLPDLDATAISAHASSLSATITAAVKTQPAAQVAHEQRVSVLLVPSARVSGRIDTIIDGEHGWIVVERKTGERRPWHARQVQLYADMVAATHPGQRVARLELWYSGREPGPVVVPIAHGSRLGTLRGDAVKGITLTSQAARQLVHAKCKGCPREDCGVKRLAWLPAFEEGGNVGKPT
ncbi:MAG: PD-(D/E)XK nuclease family protein [Candidatus Lokiarchaeota archaeon]|nr:PD-(D/E)XK nuclease family protein [Candidatus Lokiarchaeota archaeon]